MLDILRLKPGRVLTVSEFLELISASRWAINSTKSYGSANYQGNTTVSRVTFDETTTTMIIETPSFTLPPIPAYDIRWVSAGEIEIYHPYDEGSVFKTNKHQTGFFCRDGIVRGVIINFLSGTLFSLAREAKERKAEKNKARKKALRKKDQEHRRALVHANALSLVGTTIIEVVERRRFWEIRLSDQSSLLVDPSVIARKK